MSAQQIASQTMLDPFYVEYNGAKFDCRSCNKSKCCSTNDDNSPNKIPCQKCMCQHLYPVNDKSRYNSLPVFDMGCTECNSSVLQGDCNIYGYLSNKIIPKVNIVDCSNKVLVSGANNDISDVVLKSQCNTGAPLSINNPGSGRTTTYSSVDGTKDTLLNDSGSGSGSGYGSGSGANTGSITLPFKLPAGVNPQYVMIGGGVVIVIIILIMLFK